MRHRTAAHGSQAARVAASLVLAIAAIATAGSGPAAATRSGGTRGAGTGGPRRIVGFYVTDQDLPEATLDRVTHLITYVDASTTACAPNSAQQARFAHLQAMKAAHPQLRVLLSLSVGATGFSQAAASRAASQALGASCAALVDQLGFDGFDLDWEFPVGAADKANYVLLVKDLRAALDALGGDHKFLTIDSIAAWLPNQPPAFDFPKLAKVLDWFNVMDYDLNVPEMGANKTSINTPLGVPTGAVDLFAKEPNIHFSIGQYRQAGVPDHQIVMGTAFYAYRYFGVTPKAHGLWQHFDKSIDGSGGQVCYSPTVTGMLPTAERTWNEGASSPWLWGAATHTAVTYDDPQSLDAKAAYARAEGLGGVMIWHIGCDDPNGTLFSALAAGLDTAPPTTTTVPSTTAAAAPTTGTTDPGSTGSGGDASPATAVPGTPAFTG